MNNDSIITNTLKIVWKAVCVCICTCLHVYRAQLCGCALMSRPQVDVGNLIKCSCSALPPHSLGRHLPGRTSVSVASHLAPMIACLCFWGWKNCQVTRPTQYLCGFWVSECQALWQVLWALRSLSSRIF